uniref:Uncharacterized protein n=1 Tax=Romanomermis culicivorax TaxID=13658 RepID=A0A915L3P5_ROMCU
MQPATRETQPPEAETQWAMGGTQPSTVRHNSSKARRIRLPARRSWPRSMETQLYIKVTQLTALKTQPSSNKK